MRYPPPVRRKKLFRRRKRRGRLLVLAALAVVAAVVSAGFMAPQEDSRNTLQSFLSNTGGRGSGEPQLQRPDPVSGEKKDDELNLSQAPSDTAASPAAAAYTVVARQLPGVSPEDVQGTYQSLSDPSRASVHVASPKREGSDYLVFLKKTDGGWRPEGSVLADQPDHPENAVAAFGDLPGDLKKEIYHTPQNLADDARERARAFLDAVGREDWEAGEVKRAGDYARVSLEGSGEGSYLYLRRGEPGGWYAVAMGQNLTAADVPGAPGELVEPGGLPSGISASIPPAEIVMDGVPADEREKVEKESREAREAIEEYRNQAGGISGFYAIDLKGGWGYGVRPQEEFFTASVIKIPVMVAVYRKVEQGELSLDEQFAVKEEDWAAGAGGLQWEDAGAKQTVRDYLWLMITQSDNVATNALIRKVGGRDYVNEVARDMGAKDTHLVQKVTDQRAAVPSLDNRTTPRDMAVMMQSIHESEAASADSCRRMIELMENNNLEYWAESGLPQGVKMANKGGWIDGVFNDVGIVEYEDRPYAIAILTKYGPEEMASVQPVFQNTSEAVFEAEKAAAGQKKEDKEQKN